MGGGSVKTDSVWAKARPRGGVVVGCIKAKQNHMIWATLFMSWISLFTRRSVGVDHTQMEGLIKRGCSHRSIFLAGNLEFALRIIIPIKWSYGQNWANRWFQDWEKKNASLYFPPTFFDEFGALQYKIWRIKFEIFEFVWKLNVNKLDTTLIKYNSC